jgi:hypothetical protein
VALGWLRRRSCHQTPSTLYQGTGHRYLLGGSCPHLRRGTGSRPRHGANSLGGAVSLLLKPHRRVDDVGNGAGRQPLWVCLPCGGVERHVAAPRRSCRLSPASPLPTAPLATHRRTCPASAPSSTFGARRGRRGMRHATGVLDDSPVRSVQQRRGQPFGQADNARSARGKRVCAGRLRASGP